MLFVRGWGDSPLAMLVRGWGVKGGEGDSVMLVAGGESVPLCCL